MPVTPACRLLLVAIVTSVAPVSSWADARIIALHSPDGPSFYSARAVSLDGTTVVGDCWPSGPLPRACRWTVDGTVDDLGELAPGYGATATAVSADGSVVAGYASTADGDIQAFRWAPPTGMVLLGDAPSTQAHGISSDGSVITGFGQTLVGGFYAFRWTDLEGIAVLGGPSDLGWAVSGDGSTLIGGGGGHGAALPRGAFRWTQSGGFVWLGEALPNQDYFPLAANADGSVIVGSSTRPPGGHAFHWSSAGGMVALPSLPGGGRSSATSVTSDGSTVYGWDDVLGATVWDALRGTRLVADVLRDEHGLDVASMHLRLTAVSSVSGDGTRLLVHTPELEMLIDLAPTARCGLGPETALVLGALARARRFRFT